MAGKITEGLGHDISDDTIHDKLERMFAEVRVSEIYIYIYIYIYTHTHTHTHTYIYIYIYI